MYMSTMSHSIEVFVDNGHEFHVSEGFLEGPGRSIVPRQRLPSTWEGGGGGEGEGVRSFTTHTYIHIHCTSGIGIYHPIYTLINDVLCHSHVHVYIYIHAE